MRLGHEVAGLDLYELLGVTRAASPAEVRSAYRRAVRTSHPDLNPEDPRSGQRMAHVNLAGRVLLDSYLRAAYDRLTPEIDVEQRLQWYEQHVDCSASAGEWVDPPRPRRPGRPGPALRRFLSEVRGADARLSLAFSELVARTPERAKLPLFAATIACALLLIACAGPKLPWDDRPQPTSIAPRLLSP
jgi:curved DNA-binding protein CbpA